MLYKKISIKSKNKRNFRINFVLGYGCGYCSSYAKSPMNPTLFCRFCGVAAHKFDIIVTPERYYINK